MVKTDQSVIKVGVGGFKISKEEKQAVMDVLNNDRLSYGPFAKKFESKFAKLHNLKYAIFGNSGTSALQVTLHALKIMYKWQDGDEVLMPAINFVSDPNIAYFNRMKPVFVDVHPKTYNIDPEKIKAKVTKKTKVIIPVHLCGLPADMDKINVIAKKHKLKVIEDCCETLLVKYKGKPVGSMSDASCYSTYAAHILITGVGGFSCTNNQKLAILMKSLLNHGRDGIYLSIDDDNNLKGKELFNLVDRRFKFLYPGYSYRATELEAAVGYTQLRTIKQNIKKRQQNAKYLTGKLKHLDHYIQLPTIPKEREHAFMMYPIVVKCPMVSRDELIHFLESRNIETRLLLPILNQPVIKKMWGDQQKDYPVANMLNKNGFYIGCHPLMTKKDMDHISTQFEEFFKRT